MKFYSTDYLTKYMEGTIPEFNCMNEHYEMEFVKGEAQEEFAEGTLSSEKVSSLKAETLHDCVLISPRSPSVHASISCASKYNTLEQSMAWVMEL